ncbi:MAG: O-antigen ligase family protein [Lachnospiraceae bacterium]|nr:O-antigen ligase family protein [Lachnospiraceae bacterium]
MSGKKNNKVNKNTGKNGNQKNQAVKNNAAKNNANKNNTAKTNVAKKPATKQTSKSSYGNKRGVIKTVAKNPHNFFVILPVIALLSFIPLIAYNHDYESGLDKYDWYTSYTGTTDFFLYNKMVWIIVACVYMIIAVACLWFLNNEKLIWTKQMIPMAVYVVISFISAFTSIDSHYSFNGIYEQFEPVWVLVGYGIMVYYTALIVQRAGTTEKIMKWFVVGISLMTFLGMTQVLKKDFFRTPLGSAYMTGDSNAGLQFNFELGRPYLTLYNPNYVGFYVALVVPVLIALTFATKTLWKRIFYILLTFCLFAILFASQSRAGIMCLAGSLIIMVLFIRRMIFSNKKVTIASIIAIAVVIAAFVGVNAYNGDVLLSRLKDMFTVQSEFYSLEDIVTGDDDVTFYYEGNEFHMTMVNNKEGGIHLEFVDQDGKALELSENDDDGDGTVVGTVNDERFPITYSYIAAGGYCTLTITGQNYMFTNTASSYSTKVSPDDHSYYYYSGGAICFKLKKHSDNGNFFDKHLRFANLRGFMWSRTIPLLKKYFFLGSGPDTFIIAFPNDDIVGLNNSNHINEIITKPHCMYLQIGTQTGVISLLALLIFFGWYFVDSFLIYWRNKYTDYLPILGVGIMTAVIGYLVSAVTNDSCVAISPIFYCLVGLGVGINYYIKKNMSDSIIRKPKKVKVAKETAEEATEEATTEKVEEATEAKQEASK